MMVSFNVLKHERHKKLNIEKLLSELCRLWNLVWNMDIRRCFTNHQYLQIWNYTSMSVQNELQATILLQLSIKWTYSVLKHTLYYSNNKYYLSTLKRNLVQEILLTPLRKKLRDFKINYIWKGLLICNPSKERMVTKVNKKLSTNKTPFSI